MPEEIITVSNVSKVFHQNSESSFSKIAWSYFCEYILNRKNFATDKNNFYALKDIHFSLKKGESMGIIGLNGSGKSTLLQLLAGTMQPTTGKITIKGKVAALLELGSGFNPKFTGKENIYLNASLLGLEKEEIDESYDSIVRFADIGNFIDFPVRTYSSGMIVRLAFSIIAYVNADLLIIDEALAVGDNRFQAKCFSFLETFKKRGKTLIFVSHDLNLITRFTSSVIILDSGKVLAKESPKLAINKYSMLITNSITDDLLKNKNDYLANNLNKVESYNCDMNESMINSQSNDAYSLIRNDEIFSYGNKLAIIKNFKIYNENESVSFIHKSGSKFSIEFEVEAHKKITKPIYAMSIKDCKGQTIYGQNTLYAKLETNDLNQGDSVRIMFKQNLNLASGEYLISLGLTKLDNEKIKVIHRLYDVVKISVINNDGSFGLANCFSSITINKV